jgi:ribosomal protein L32E
MPQKTYNKPNRKKTRVYSPCDVRRIVVYCLNDNPSVKKEELLALIAKTLGFTHIALNERVDIEEKKRTSQLVDALETYRDKIDDFLRGLGVDV